MQHVFIDVEAYGPPGHGRPFALGACKFDKEHRVYERFQRGISWPGVVQAHQQTLDWLLGQPPYVLAQGRVGAVPFRAAYDQFQMWLDIGPVTFWADDWSDFAWLDYEVRAREMKPLRDHGRQLDSSAIVALADPLKEHIADTYGELKEHIAEHDAVRGALDLLAALHILRRELP